METAWSVLPCHEMGTVFRPRRAYMSTAERLEPLHRETVVARIGCGDHLTSTLFLAAR
jgi:hypothetical protein